MTTLIFPFFPSLKENNTDITKVGQEAKGDCTFVNA